MATREVRSPSLRYARALGELPVEVRGQLRNISELESPGFVKRLAAGSIIGKELAELRREVIQGDGLEAVENMERKVAQDN